MHADVDVSECVHVDTTLLKQPRATLSVILSECDCRREDLSLLFISIYVFTDQCKSKNIDLQLQRKAPYTHLLKYWCVVTSSVITMATIHPLQVRGWVIPAH